MQCRTAALSQQIMRVEFNHSTLKSMCKHAFETGRMWACSHASLAVTGCHSLSQPTVGLGLRNTCIMNECMASTQSSAMHCLYVLTSCIQTISVSAAFFVWHPHFHFHSKTMHVSTRAIPGCTKRP
jgi:hypothetical protein